MDSNADSGGEISVPPPEIEIPPNSDSNSTDSRQMVMASSQEFFAGPLPPPRILKGYEEVLSGSADRIFRMAENEQSHRHALEVDEQKHFQQMVSIQVKTDSTLQNRVCILGLRWRSPRSYQVQF